MQIRIIFTYLLLLVFACRRVRSNNTTWPLFQNWYHSRIVFFTFFISSFIRIIVYLFLFCIRLLSDFSWNKGKDILAEPFCSKNQKRIIDVSEAIREHHLISEYDGTGTQGTGFIRTCPAPKATLPTIGLWDETSLNELTGWLAPEETLLLILVSCFSYVTPSPSLGSFMPFLVKKYLKNS